ncbi:uncharacterized protein LOC128882483 [Hylaeus volcanicus]|uniref:uncharacterized protein LOC128882483 n=1 Tax=Hylaeus volcanicus TaxID=313075 RepID=UPI0023B806D0|nr:uncharacterized protein LOC128882483 [Hylaeus volcanicus]
MMDKKISNRDISSRHKRRLAQIETEKDYLLLESSSSSEASFELLHESIKKRKIENNDNDASVSTSSLISNSEEGQNTSEVVTDDEDFIDIEEQDEMQSLSLNCDSSSDDAGDESVDNELLHNLQNLCFEFNIRHNAINSLLEILRNTPPSQFKSLPKNARVLLKTPKKTAEIVALAGGSYHHFGLSDALESILQHYKNMSLELSAINLLINIDGLSIFKSSPSAFWPILVSDDISKQVHIVGIFYGQKKPNNANEYLEPFVKELIPLVQRGYHSDIIQIKV